MREVIALVSGLVVFGTTVPYLIDVLKGNVRPVRSTRIMFLLLLLLALMQQRSMGVGVVMVITISELAATILLFAISMRKGVGGLSRLDVVCYLLLAASIVVWYGTKSAYIGLIFTILADFVAFFPVIHRTIFDPKSETQLFYWGGVIGPLLAIVADPNKTTKNILFTAYLAMVNFLVVLLINRQYLRQK
jgi:hypothetical protein